MKYAGTISILNDVGESVYERELTADEMIDCLIDAAANPVLTDPEAEEAAATPARAAFKEGMAKVAKQTPKGGKKQTPHCSICGEAGHRATTCGRAKEVNDQFTEDERFDKERKAQKQKKAFEASVARMVAVGCSIEEIKVAFPKKTERELEEAIAYAQHAV